MIEVPDVDPGLTKEKWGRIAHILRTKPRDWQIMLQRLAQPEKDDGKI